jgi:biopolymer transport protein TolR
MKSLLLASLVVLGVGACVVPDTAAQSPAMQKGVSVQLAVSTNAAPMPDADNEDSFIVTVTEEGTVYLGVNRITLGELKEKVRSTPLKKEQKLYIKADARAPYARVLEVLDATSTGGMAQQVLLTGHTKPSTTGMITPPEGVEVRLGHPLDSSR